MEHASLLAEIQRHSNMAKLQKSSRITDESMKTLSEVARRLFDLNNAFSDVPEIHLVYREVAELLFERGGMTGSPFEVAWPKWEGGQLTDGYPPELNAYPRPRS